MKQDVKFRIISSNVRVDTSSRFYHEHKWSERKGHIIEMLSNHAEDKPTLIGLQELKHHQLNDLISGMNALSEHPWSYYGVGRDDGVRKGEYAPIFYQPAKWELLNSTTKWLSTTPDMPSKFGGAACTRIVTMTTFKNLETGICINMLNTHYDHKSEQARGLASELIMKFINLIPNDYKTFLSGDFNSISSDASYKTLVKELKDTREIAYDKQSYMNTYTGFEPSDVHNVIDFIWCQEDVKIETYNVIDTWTEQGFRSTDHRPVIVDIVTY